MTDTSHFMGPADASSIDQLSQELLDLRLDLEIIKEHIKSREERLTSLIDEDVGSTTIKGNRYSVEISRNEIMKWDSDGLLDHYYGGAFKSVTPLDITGKISKSSFSSMSESERNDVIKYLEIKPGKASIKISENEEPHEF